MVLPVVFCGCATGSVILREECRLGMFKNRVPKEIFRTKREEVKERCKNVHNEGGV